MDVTGGSAPGLSGDPHIPGQTSRGDVSDEPRAATPVPRSTTGPDEPLRISVSRPGNEVVVLGVYGAVDTESEGWFAETLRHRLRSLATVIVLDLSSVSYLNSEGAMTLMDAAHDAEVRSKPLGVVSSPAVDRTLELLHVADRFRWFPSVSAALSAMTPHDPLPENRAKSEDL